MSLMQVVPGRESVGCDLCGHREARFRYSLPNSAILTCADCGLSYVSPRATPDVMAATLQLWARSDILDADRLAAAFDPPTMALYARHLARVETACGGSGRLLDVGCATGAFMTAARDRGWSVQGLEIGAASAAYARDRLGLDVRQASLYDQDLPSASFDAVALLEVIEHLPSPTEALRRLWRWLRPGGVLLVSTPNFDSLFRRMHGVGWWVINCEDEHIVLFNPATLAAALHAAGFEVLDVRTRSIDYAGLAGQFRRHAPAAAAAGEDHGYFAARSRKAKIKALAASFGVLGAARGLLALQDAVLLHPRSPARAMGEQIIALARKPVA